ncbi:DUF3108 domain-containing protein [Pseudoalteromonas mariniglutinosa]|uniref:DUF3108 domain-containing protein n=1 Tax=Pseudoalteromonas mariniglutinosa TaxID=206042 RepID=UPI00384C6B9B
MVRTTQNKKRSALLTCVGTLLLPTSVFAGDLTQYKASYDVLRKGETHGKAVRELKKIADNNYVLTYHSDIEWMIFSDSRKETSQFTYQNQRISPLSYKMERTGTGPDKDYSLQFNAQQQQIKSSESDYPLQYEWSNEYQDSLSYQVQVREELKKGKTELSYPLIDKKGNLRSYDFAVLGTEMISLPIGNIEAIKVKRLYDNDKRQALAWFAPEMDYMLVRMWKGEKGVEQFEVQLNSFTVTSPMVKPTKVQEEIEPAQ